MRTTGPPGPEKNMGMGHTVLVSLIPSPQGTEEPARAWALMTLKE